MGESPASPGDGSADLLDMARQIVCFASLLREAAEADISLQIEVLAVRLQELVAQFEHLMARTTLSGDEIEELNWLAIRLMRIARFGEPETD